jgi:membrane protease YdiL (CAAX protease family)
LGVVFLKKGFNTYTVRQMDLFMPISLEEVYDRLNFADPAVRCRTQNNKWGGSADIGGSPRDTGTQMDPSEIVQACHEAVRKPGLAYQAYHFISTAVLLGAIVLCSMIVHFSWNSFQWVDAFPGFQLLESPDFGFTITLLAASAVALILAAFRRPWQYGWSAPMGKTWWLLLPFVLAAGALGGVWTPERLFQSTYWSQGIVLGVLGIPLASELLFRGLGHGLMAQTTTIQRCDSRWFLSWPVIGTALAYTAYIWILTHINTPISNWSEGFLKAATTLIFGLGLGMVRERSQSLLPAMLFHILAASAAFLLARFIA